MGTAAIDPEQARARVLAVAGALAAEPVALEAAYGRTLAGSVLAAHPVPAFANSAMDGYAVRAVDTAPGARLRIVAESRAGQPATRGIAAGEACAISTGAALPAGADAVIRVEDTRRSDAETVELSAAVGAGDDVRRVGGDIPAGATVLAAGTRIDVAAIGLLAAVGCATVHCHRRPRVGVVTSGDELVPVGARGLEPGEIYDSSAYVLPELARRAGAEIASIEHVRDRPADTRDALERALAADVVLISGGMSVGEHDHVHAALAELGATVEFAGVALKPGRPAAFARRGSTLIFGLPGNPVSSLIAFLLLARPALIALAGGHPQRVRSEALLEAPFPRTPGRTHAVRCELALHPNGWHARSTGDQESHRLSSLLGADAVALIPPGDGELAAGERVTVELLEGL
jgi:molybdopterin molybdotransferase